MADLAKSGTPSLASVLLPANAKHTGLVAGEAIAGGDICYIKSDGKVWRSNGTAATAPAKVDGFASQAAAAGDPITLIFNMTVGWANTVNPGTSLFVGTTAGDLTDTATTGGTSRVGVVIDANRVYLNRSSY